MTEEKTTHIRPSWDEYFTDIANTVSERATCDRGYGGCVIARDKQILVTGYVGSPKGAPHCDDVGHQIKTTIHEDGHQSQHCVRTVHMELNAICQAAKLGISINGGTIYVKYTPCFTCAKMLVNAGIVRVVCQRKYHAAIDSEEVFKCAGVELVYLSEDLEQYDKQ